MSHSAPALELLAVDGTPERSPRPERACTETEPRTDLEQLEFLVYFAAPAGFEELSELADEIGRC